MNHYTERLDLISLLMGYRVSRRLVLFGCSIVSLFVLGLQTSCRGGGSGSSVGSLTILGESSNPDLARLSKPGHDLRAEKSKRIFGFAMRHAAIADDGEDIALAT